MIIRLLVNLIILTLAISAARAEKMDTTTHSLLIDKLERVLEIMEAGNPKKAQVTLRLADLYAERARLNFIEDTEKNIEPARSRQDRKRALELYKASVDSLEGNQKGPVILQMAQLHELQGEADQAMNLYEGIIKNKKEAYSPELVGQSYAGIGEIYFRKIKFEEALRNFEKALAIKQTPQRDFIKYRVSWCYFHQDKLKKAIELLVSVLKTPDLKADGSFREEAARDLATYLARGHVGAKEIKTLNDLTSEGTRKDNFEYLASELDRLGKKKESLYVLNVTQPKSVDASDLKVQKKDQPKDQIEEHLRVAQLQYDIGKKDLTVSELGDAVKIWAQCQDKEFCEGLRQKFRHLVTNWGKAEEDAPSAQLIQAYGLYTSVFAEPKVNYWAAEAARRIKLYKEAIQFYKAAAAGSYGSDSATFEGALFGIIEVAELSKDKGLREDAYKYYLANNSKGKRSFQVRYQLTHLQYENQQFNDAAKAFHDLALDKSGDRGLREKSADLALDTLVLAHNDELLESWALEFSHIFKKRSKDFNRIAEKVALNNVASTLNNRDANDSDLDKKFAKLQGVNPRRLSHDEQVSYYKNKLIISEKLRKLPEVVRAADGLLSIKGVSREDQDFALSRKEWVAELKLNFKEAYRFAQKMGMPGLPQDEKLLKLALLAELAGANPEPYEIQYLQISRNETAVQTIIAEMVRRSRSPLSVLHAYRSRLATNPSLYTTLALEIFAHTHDYKFADQTLRVAGARQTPSGEVLHRFVLLKDLRDMSQKASTVRVSSRDARTLRRSLNERVKWLNRLESFAARAVESRDWSVQVLALRTVEWHYHSLARDIESLPIPRGLTRKRRAQYKQLLTQQSAPYRVKAQAVNSKLGEMWHRTEFLNDLETEIVHTTSDLRKLMLAEVRQISRAAPSDKRREVYRLFAVGAARPSSQEIQVAKQSVKENPFSASDLEKLRGLEQKAGQQTMVAYLDARIARLRSGVYQ